MSLKQQAEIHSLQSELQRQQIELEQLRGRAFDMAQTVSNHTEILTVMRKQMAENDELVRELIKKVGTKIMSTTRATRTKTDDQVQQK